MKRKRKGGGMLKFIKENFGWVKDVAIVLAMAAVLYLNGHYITKEVFEASQTKNEIAHQSITTTLISVDKTLALMSFNESAISEVKNEMKIRSKQIDELVAQNKVDAQYNILIDKLSVKVAELDTIMKGINAQEWNTFMRESMVQRENLNARLKSLEDSFKRNNYNNGQ